MAEKTKVFVYDDNTGRQEALKLLLDSTGDMEMVGAMKNCNTVEDDLAIYQPEVILMDIDMPETNGIEGLIRIKKESPGTLVIMQTVFEDEEKIVASIQNGANGYFLKRTPPYKLLDGIREVLDGGAPMTAIIAAKVLKLFRGEPAKTTQNDANLTQKEREVLNLLSKGFSYKMISDELKISYHTVNSHVKKIYDKLQVHSATEAIAKAFENK